MRPYPRADRSDGDDDLASKSRSNVRVVVKDHSMGGGSPRFRQDLEANSVEADGVVYVEVSDRESGRSFRFYEFEHAVALALDGSALDTVVARLHESNQIELTVDQLAA